MTDTGIGRVKTWPRLSQLLAFPFCFRGLRLLHGKNSGKVSEFVDKLGKRDIRVDDLTLALQEAISDMNAQALAINSIDVS